MAVESREYKGHLIELVSPETTEGLIEDRAEISEAPMTLLIDGELVPYGQMPGGQYFLHDYAYDWTNDLLDLAQRWIDYRAKKDSTEG